MSESAKKSVFMRPGRLVQMSEADAEMSELKNSLVHVSEAANPHKT